MRVPFNKPPYIGTEKEYIIRAVETGHISGDGEYTKLCSNRLKEITGSEGVLLTTSCTHATEMAALLSDIKPGDEVIMPSYTFVSTADAFVLRGAVPVFVDIRPDTMNINEQLIEDAITEKTKAIVPVHYAGVGCEMDTIMDIADRHSLTVIEDAAQAIDSYYKGKALGTFGQYGCFSFHETKNISMGEGGALLIQNAEKIESAEIIREKGTNRAKFFRGQIDKYTWVNYGSSYLPSDLNAAYLWAQLENIDKIQSRRHYAWNMYKEGLSELEKKELIQFGNIPDECTNNAHMFYIKVKDLDERSELLYHLKNKGILATFHYVPLHSAPAGIKYGRFFGKDVYTTSESERLIRLPLFYGISDDEIEFILDEIKRFMKNK